MSILEIKGLSAAYGRKEILQDISLTVGEGETVGILGQNGCGKTTLIKALCGILPYRGSARLNGCELGSLKARPLARKVGYVPQKSGLSLSVSLLDTVLMGFNPELGLLEAPSGAMREAALRMLARVGLEERAEEDFQTLSEGQKQSVILARALVGERQLLLMDEPENALDFGGRYRMAALVRSYLSEGSEPRSALITLHDPQLALSFCDRLVLLSEGRVAGELAPAEASAEEIGELLGRIYGRVSVITSIGPDGRKRRLLIKEADDGQAIG